MQKTKNDFERKRSVITEFISWSIIDIATIVIYITIGNAMS